ncbi:MAG: hypothetical protein ACE366_13485 [Bradymonadia bacterium]
MNRTARHGALALALICATACTETFDNRPEGLRLTSSGGGPKVIFDPEARPLPEIPFPNDVATRIDPTSPTGRRVNFPILGETLRESALREKANKLDGFGLFAPITVQFDAPIDVVDLQARHNNHDLIDDAIYLVNVDPDSPGFGERVQLDIGANAPLPEAMRIHPEQRAPTAGRFPVALDRPSQYFDHDPRTGSSTLVFETRFEFDEDNDGVLDDAEDTDGDGVFDRPNTIDGEAYAPGSIEEVDAVLSFYERETNTLIIRTVMPLREATTYAVVLSKFVTDEQGRPIESPFDFINHTRQSKALEPLPEVLPQYGLNMRDVAFAWTFTTQSATLEMQMIRRGLYADGPLSWLSERFPARLDALWSWTDDEALAACEEAANGNPDRLARCEHPYGVKVLTAEKLRAIVGPLGSQLVDDPSPLVDAYRYVDYMIAGTFISPDFLTDRDGYADEFHPQNDDESFEIDLAKGDAVVGDGKVTFWCTIPKSLEYTDLDGTVRRHEPPFPVVLYGHGYGGSRLEMLGFAGHHARFGLATCATDAVGHGLTLPQDLLDLATNLLPNLVQRDGMAVEPVVHNITEGRHRDLNNDGIRDSGGDFWTEDVFHTRDMVRQSAVDWLQLVRVLRSFDGTRESAVDRDGDDVPDGLAGDFNGDGVVDLGGPSNDYFAWGQSLGGIMSVLAPAVEPSMVAVAPTAGGAGLIDIAVRSIDSAVPRVVVLRMMGPMILGDPINDEEGNPTGRYQLNWLVPNTSPPASTPRARRIPIAEVQLNPGEIFSARNLTRERRAEIPAPDRHFAVVKPEGFRVHYAADAWSSSDKRALLGLKPEEEGFEPLRMTEAQVLESGDEFIFEVYSPTELDVPRLVVDAWGADAEWQGAIYPEGSPIVATGSGYGHERQSSDLRRFFNIAQAILDAGDPAAYGVRYTRDPIDMSDLEPDRLTETRALVVSTTGDQNVPINTGIALARVMGIIDTEKPRGDLFGLTEDEFLMAVGAYEGTVQYPRWWDDEGPYNFDVDDLDNGRDGYVNDPRGNFKLRLTKPTPQGGLTALRMPYMGRSNRVSGVDAHGIDASTPSRDFDISTFMANQISLYFLKRGQGLTARQLDAPCLQFLGNDPRSCPIAPLYPED